MRPGVFFIFIGSGKSYSSEPDSITEKVPCLRNGKIAILGLLPLSMMSPLEGPPEVSAKLSTEIEN